MAPCADGGCGYHYAVWKEVFRQVAGFVFLVAGEQPFAGGAPEHGCGPRVVAMTAAGFFGVGGGVHGSPAVGVEAVADVDAGFVHGGHHAAQPFCEPVGFRRVDGACGGVPQPGVVAQQLGLAGEAALWCWRLVEACGPCVQRFEDVAVPVDVEQVVDGFVHGCGCFAAPCSPVAALVSSVGAVDPVVFDVMEVGGEPGEVGVGERSAVFAGVLGCVGGVADGAGGAHSWVPFWLGLRLSSMVRMVSANPVMPLFGVLWGL